jgi:hypothetical protein
MGMILNSRRCVAGKLILAIALDPFTFQLLIKTLFEVRTKEHETGTTIDIGDPVSCSGAHFLQFFLAAAQTREKAPVHGKLSVVHIHFFPSDCRPL